MQQKAIQQATQMVAEFLDSEKEFSAFQNSGKRIFDATVMIGRSWSGSSLGYHSGLYYGDFQPPPLGREFSVEWGGIHGIPQGWAKKTPEQVKEAIEKLSSITSLDSFENEMKILRERAEGLRTEMGVLFSAFTFNKSLEKERELLAQIEAFKFGSTKEAYIEANMRTQVMTRDSGALMQGIVLPSHLYYQGVAHEGDSLCDAVNRFVKLCQRFLRQLSKKLEMSSTSGGGIGRPASRNPCEVSTALRERIICGSG